MEEMNVLSIDDLYKAQVKPYTRTRRGKLERVKGYGREFQWHPPVEIGKINGHTVQLQSGDKIRTWGGWYKHDKIIVDGIAIGSIQTRLRGGRIDVHTGVGNAGVLGRDIEWAIRYAEQSGLTAKRAEGEATQAKITEAFEEPSKARVPVKEVPSIGGIPVKNIVKEAFPDYKGRKISVETSYVPTHLDSYWDEGHRTYYAFYELATRKTHDIGSNHPFFEGNRPRFLSKLPEGVVLVARTYWGAHPQFVTVYANASDVEATTHPAGALREALTNFTAADPTKVLPPIATVTAEKKETKQTIIEVYHNRDTDFFNAPDEINIHALTHVADVKVDTLDDAYEKTNHIDRNWMENKEVTPKVGKARSTSIGDVMRIGDQWFVVDSVGFKPVKIITEPYQMRMPNIGIDHWAKKSVSEIWDLLKAECRKKRMKKAIPADEWEIPKRPYWHRDPGTDEEEGIRARAQYEQKEMARTSGKVKPFTRVRRGKSEYVKGHERKTHGGTDYTFKPTSLAVKKKMEAWGRSASKKLKIKDLPKGTLLEMLERAKEGRRALKKVEEEERRQYAATGSTGGMFP